MLTLKSEFLHIAEVNPPQLPDMTHLRLAGAWEHALVTDNVFGKVRVSPYAFAARLTHDVPSVHPTIVVSTRDRNILAIESEVRGALGNGVDSFLVVVGDTYPTVDHSADHFEIVEHLRALQEVMPAFEVGMPCRFRRWHLQRRIDLGAQFFVAGPVLDPDAVEECASRLELKEGEPPVYLSVIPPFSLPWVERAERWGAQPVSPGLRERIANTPEPDRRGLGWALTREAAERAETAGLAGVVLMGLKFTTLVEEGSAALARADPG
jgi:5,10-methylenetetrahydrofolate reductase